MKKILYLSNMDWKWIYQRHQVLALGLEREYDVKVVWGRTLIHRWKAQNNKKPKKYSQGIVLPLQNRFRVLQWIHEKSMRLAMGKVSEYDIIWVAEPRHIRIIPDSFKGKIIYDCMDRYSELVDKKATKKDILESEKKLINKANLIIVTSNYLKNYVRVRYGKDSYLIRNGVMGLNYHDVLEKKLYDKNEYNIAYVGTVAPWFDLDLLYDTAKDEIKYHIFGPCSEQKILSPIEYGGVLEHDKIYDAVKNYECLIMPFKVNKLVKAIDPVKLYEYISYGKCIISVYYKELEHFSDFVYFYHSRTEYLELIDRLKNNGFLPKYNKNQQEKFLFENNWDKRIKDVLKVIDNII